MFIKEGFLHKYFQPYIGFDHQLQTQVEGDPMIYIVTMLLVFSAGIASLMVIYMKKEQVDFGHNDSVKFNLIKARVHCQSFYIRHSFFSSEPYFQELFRILMKLISRLINVYIAAGERGWEPVQELCGRSPVNPNFLISSSHPSRKQKAIHNHNQKEMIITNTSVIIFITIMIKAGPL